MTNRTHRLFTPLYSMAMLLLLLLVPQHAQAVIHRGYFDNDAHLSITYDKEDCENCVLTYIFLYNHNGDDSGFRTKEGGAHVYLNGTLAFTLSHQDEDGRIIEVDSLNTLPNIRKLGWKLKSLDYASMMNHDPLVKHRYFNDANTFNYCQVEFIVPVKYLTNQTIKVRIQGKWWRWGDGWEDESVDYTSILNVDYPWNLGKLTNSAFGINSQGKAVGSWDYEDGNCTKYVQASWANTTKTAVSEQSKGSKDEGFLLNNYVQHKLDDINMGSVFLPYSSTASKNINVTLTLGESLNDAISLGDTISYKGFPYPKNIKCTFDDEGHQTNLTWEVVGDRTLSYVKNGHWVVMRTDATTQETVLRDDGVDLSKNSWSETDLEYGHEYTYKVYYCHDDWGNEADLGLKNLAASSNTIVTAMNPGLEMTASAEEDRVNLTITLGSTKTAGLYNLSLYRDTESTLLKDFGALPAGEHSLNFSDVRSEDNPLSSTKGHNYIAVLTQLKPSEANGREAARYTLSKAVTGSNVISNLTVSKGSYTNRVVLNWQCLRDASDESLDNYVIRRAKLGVDGNADEDLTEIATMKSLDRFVTYSDENLTPGVYYQYSVGLTDDDADADNILSEIRGIGFATNTATITGTVTYQNGTALQDGQVKLVSKRSGMSDVEATQYRSREFNATLEQTTFPAFNLPIDSTRYAKLMETGFTLQFWFKPQVDWDSSVSGDQLYFPLVYFPNNPVDMFGIVAEKESSQVTCRATNFRYLAGSGSTYSETANGSSFIEFNNNTWAHFSIYVEPGNSTDGYTSHIQGYFLHDGEWSKSAIPEWSDEYYYSAPVDQSYFDKEYTQLKADGMSYSPIFGYKTQHTLLEQHPYSGLLDEIQLWEGQLTDDQLERYRTQHLSGKEDGLVCYLPMDEGLQGITLDKTYKGQARSTRYAELPAVVASSTDVPDMLTNNVVYTNANGQYTFTDVTYQDGGNTIDVVPMYGTHEFSPSVQQLFVSANSLVHSAVDFTDKSSFPVTGTVTYYGGNFPVEGATLYIDGTMAKVDGKPVQTDSKGHYAMDVPIGNHFINVKMDNHEFCSDGRWPALASSTYNFQTAVNEVNFQDSTLVTIVGRVAGGALQAQLPIAAGEEGGSRANIGQATLYLKPVSNLGYSINTSEEDTIVTQNDDERILSQTLLLPYERNSSLPSQIEIKTDKRTGEFSAKLPPLSYQVVYGYTKSVSNDSLQAYNATQINPILGQTITDEARVEDPESPGDSLTYTSTYHTKTIIRFDSQPELTMADVTHLYDTALGDSLQTVNKMEFPMYTVSEEGGQENITYTLGYPCFTTGTLYRMKISGYQYYVNKDGDEPVTERVPMAGTVIDFTKSSWGDGDYDETTTLNEDGQGTYTFKARQPLQEDGAAAYPLQGSYTLGTRTYVFPETPAEGVMLGYVANKGTEMLALGPDIVDFVLRDPPGSESFATLNQGSTLTTNVTMNGAGDDTRSQKYHLFLGANYTYTDGVGLFGLAAVTFGGGHTIKAGAAFDHSKNNTTGSSNDTVFTQTRTLTESISTGSDAAHVGANGDVYIGRNSVMSITKGFKYAFYADKPSDPETTCIEITNASNQKAYLYGASAPAMGTVLGATFAYSQRYLTDELIPQLEEMRNSYILDYTTDTLNLQWGANDTVKYVSKVPSTDATFGDNDQVSEFYNPNISKDKITDINVINQFNNWITGWKTAIRSNEQKKCAATYDRQLAISAGTPYSENYNISRNVTTAHSQTLVKQQVTLAGVKANVSYYVGVDIDNMWGDGVGNYSNTHSTQWNETKETNLSLGFTIKDSDSHDYFSIGISDSVPSKETALCSNIGYMYHLNGGASCNPWEGPEYTNYYMAGKKLISDGTLKVYKPTMRFETSNITDVPNGRETSIKLIMKNESEVNIVAGYELYLMPATNPYGMQVYMDGTPLTNVPTLINFKAGETVTKLLKLKQTRSDIMDYDNITLNLRPTVIQAFEISNTDLCPTASFSVHYKPSCSAATLTVRDTLQKKITNLNLSTGSDVVLEATDYDTSYRGFFKMILQRRGEAETDWHTIHEWAVNDSIAKADNISDVIGEKSTVSYRYSLKDLADQKYLFRIVTYGHYGIGTEAIIPNNCDTVTITKDMQAPQVLGNIEPANGILTAEDDVSLTFNESIYSNGIVDDDIKVEATLNQEEETHSRALSFDGQTPAKTTSRIRLNSTFSIEGWIKPNFSNATTLLSHSESQDGLKIGFNNGGYLTVTLNDTTVTSTVKVETNDWMYLGVSMNANHALLAYALYNDLQGEGHEDVLLSCFDMPTYNQEGRLSVGTQFTGAVHGLTLWNKQRMISDYADRTMTRTGRESGLIGYWPMTEGHGTVAADKCLSRNLQLGSGTQWYSTTQNYVAHFTGESELHAMTDQIPISQDNDFAVECWFKPEATTTTTQTLFQMGNYGLGLVGGTLAFITNQTTTVLNPSVIENNAWHHVAMNVIRNMTTNIYLDGTLYGTLSKDSIGAIATPYYIIGKQFQGDIDEIRVWKAHFTGDALLQNQYSRVDTAAAGLVMYYPMEISSFIAGSEARQTVANICDCSTNHEEMEQQNVTTQLSTLNLADTKYMQTVPCNWEASSDRIVISPTAAVKDIEHCTLNFTVDHIQDLNGNTITEPIKWSTYVDMNRLRWSQTERTLIMYQGVAFTNEVTLINKSDAIENWEIVDVPSWLQLAETSGSLTPLTQKTITLGITDGTPAGCYETTIYLVGNNSVREPLHVTLDVLAKQPDWAVDPTQFEYSDVLTTMVKIEGDITEDTGDLVAAFVDGTCVGLTYPKDIDGLDYPLVMMNIYSNADMAGRPVTFKVWDSQTGLIYPSISIYDGNGTLVPQIELTTTHAIYGSPTAPYMLVTDDNLENTITVNNGWAWTTINVDRGTGNMRVQDIFGTSNPSVFMVKSQSDNLQWSSFYQRWGGTLTEDLKPAQMYMLYGACADDLTVIGRRVNPTEVPISLESGWNWIGYTPQESIDLTTALADAVPQEGDMVKSQRAFAYYTNHTWVGTLTYMEPGQGYVYYAAGDNRTSTFYYPESYQTTYDTRAQRLLEDDETSGETTAPLLAQRRETAPEWTWNHYAYSSNMTLTAHVLLGNRRVTNGKVAAFDSDGVCRGVQSISDDELLYLIISGDDACALNLRLWDAETDKVYEIPAPFTFFANKMVGNINEPSEVQFDGSTAIRTIADGSAEEGDLYDLSGRRRYEPIQRGVYIEKGKKVVR